MSPEHWETVKEILDAALEVPASARAGLVRRMTADREIISEVECLIAAEGPSLTDILHPPDTSSAPSLTTGLLVDRRYRLERRLASAASPMPG